MASPREASGRAGLREGSHALGRKHVRYFDLEKIARGTEPLSPSEQAVAERLSENPQEALLAKLDLEAALTVLTAQQRVCVQRSLEGYTVREIAQQLGLSYGNVQVYLTAAKQKLKKYFQESS